MEYFYAYLARSESIFGGMERGIVVGSNHAVPDLLGTYNSESIMVDTGWGIEYDGVA